MMIDDRWLFGSIRPATSLGVGRNAIVKVGGSLLTRPSWPEDLRALVASLDAPCLVVGGGPIVDGLRQIDATRRQPADLMHTLAIDAMRLTARIVADALGLPTSAALAPRFQTAMILDTPAWLESDPAGSTIPVGWQVTSDSIAATIAAATDRDLLLVKSLSPPCPGDNLAALAAAGWVDDHFPTAAASLRRIAWGTCD